MTAKPGILGLGSRLYPGNMQRILKKDLTRFMQSFSRTPKSSKQKKGSASRVLFLSCSRKSTCFFKVSRIPRNHVVSLMFRVEVGEVEWSRITSGRRNTAINSLQKLHSPRSFSTVALTIAFLHRRLSRNLSSQISQLFQ